MPEQRILMVIPELTMGGAQSSFSKLAWALSEKYEVITVVFDFGSSVFYQMPGEVLRLSNKPTGSYFSKFHIFLTRLKRLRALKKQFRPIATISFLEGADYLNILSREQDKIIISIRGSKLHDPNLKSYFFWLRTKFLIPMLYSRADKIVCVSNGIAKELDDMVSLNRRNLSVIGNYLEDKSPEKDMSSSMDIDVSRFSYFVYSGRLANEKGLKGIVKIFSVAKEEIRSLKLVLIGDGPERESIFSYANSLNLRVGSTWDNDVLLIGTLRETKYFVINAIATLMNSVSEGFPNSMAESLHYKTPVITADCPYGPRELFELGEGKPIVSKQYPIFTGGGVLLPNISEATMNIWKSVLVEFVGNKRAIESEFYSKLVKATSKEIFLTNWQKVIQQ
jgi:glycosyltransferase involved in cell wall biosynthesis